jgi:hypothetical protein
MKLLVVIPDLAQLDAALQQLGVQLTPAAGIKYLQQGKILHHEADILETGAGIYQTTYKLAKVLGAHKYHLALKLSTGAAYRPEAEAGQILNIVNEKPGDYGTTTAEGWKDMYDLGMLNRNSEPHVRGGFINLTNAYMNVFMPFKKVVGVTVNHYADATACTLRKEKYKADCETTDGLGFVYTCLYEHQQYYHLCAIERNIATGAENRNLALQILNETFTDLIQKL